MVIISILVWKLNTIIKMIDIKLNIGIVLLLFTLAWNLLFAIFSIIREWEEIIIEGM